MTSFRACDVSAVSSTWPTIGRPSIGLTPTIPSRRPSSSATEIELALDSCGHLLRGVHDLIGTHDGHRFPPSGGLAVGACALHRVGDEVVGEIRRDRRERRTPLAVPHVVCLGQVLLQPARNSAAWTSRRLVVTSAAKATSCDASSRARYAPSERAVFAQACPRSTTGSPKLGGNGGFAAGRLSAPEARRYRMTASSCSAVRGPQGFVGACHLDELQRVRRPRRPTRTNGSARTSSMSTSAYASAATAGSE